LCNKALQQIHRRGDDDMCGGSPLFDVLSSFCFSVWVKDVGEITQERRSKFILSFSPLLMVLLVVFFLSVKKSGRYTGRGGIIYTLVLPSLFFV